MSFDLLDWLKNSSEYPKFFWKGKTAKKLIATIGKKEKPGLFQNCVFSFDLKTSHIWSPKYERFSNKSFATLKEENYTIVKKETVPSFETWKGLISKGKALEKVVLARKHILTFNKKICPFNIMQKVMQKSPSGFLFLYQIDEENTFLGASPETLFYRCNDTIFTEAVAGTKKRGKTLEEEKKLCASFLKDAKENQEFSYVSNYLEKWLKKQCINYEKSKLTILKTPWVQHLQMTFHGTLKHKIDDLHLIKTLHPTPAVGGTPRKIALSFLKENEPFDRIFYAAPIGRKSENEAEFAVAIRSCIIYKNTISIYSGTGIVKDSDPQKEWEELNHKMKWILDVLN